MGLQTREEGGGCPPGSSSECCVCSFCFSPGNTAVCGSSVSAPPPKAGQAVPRPGCWPRERRAGARSPPVTMLPGEARGRRRPRVSHRGPPPQGLGQTCISDGGSSRPRVQGRDGGTPQPPAPRPPAAPPEEGVLPLRAGARREALLQRLPPRCVCSLAAFCWEARHLIPKRAACGLIVQLSRAVKQHPRWPGGGWFVGEANGPQGCVIWLIVRMSCTPL